MKNLRHMLNQMECQDTRHKYRLFWATWIYASPTWLLKAQCSVFINSCMTVGKYPHPSHLQNEGKNVCLTELLLGEKNV